MGNLKLTKLILLFIVYFVTAKFGLTFDPVSNFATLVWLPTGISLAAVLIFGSWILPAIVAGAFLVNFTSGATPLAAAGMSVGNTLEAVVGAYILKKVHFKFDLSELRDVLWLTVVAFSATMVSAFLGVTSLYLNNMIESSAVFPTIQAWWIGDMLSILTIAPLIFVWVTNKYKGLFLDRKFEGLVTGLLLILSTLVVFRGQFEFIGKNSPVTYLIEPVLIWIALRFSPKELITAIFIIMVIAIKATVEGTGPFATSDLSRNLLLLQGYIGVTSVTSMVLTAAIQEKKDSEKRKDAFISMASHELKTPITSMKLYIQVLIKEIKKKRMEKSMLPAFSSIETQTDRLSNLVNDLLDVSRITTGQLRFRQTNFDINNLVKETITMLKSHLSKHEIIVIGNIKKKVHADRDRIMQVLINLLTNAIKYSPRSGKIIIRLKSTPGEILVSVKDFGLGIAEKDKIKVFERFYQSDNNKRAKTKSGLGVGLHISKEIIKRHRGRIWVESKVGKGSTFFFTIPG